MSHLAISFLILIIQDIFLIVLWYGDPAMEKAGPVSQALLTVPHPLYVLFSPAAGKTDLRQSAIIAFLGQCSSH